MKAFSRLYKALDETNKTTGKVDAMVKYFETTPPEDAVWGLYFLTGRRPRRPVNTTKMWGWANELSGLPAWLFSECYDAVADLAETIAKIVPEPPEPPDAEAHSLSHWVNDRLLPLANISEEDQKVEISRAWAELDIYERMVYNKLITGEFRVGVSQDLVIRAVSQAGGVPAQVVAHRLMGSWEPTAEFFQSLFSEDHTDADISKPYPFCLAHPLEGAPDALGDIDQWQVEWKYDGIRAQLIRREGHTFVWSRGEDLITERFPEVADVGEWLPDGTVIDGEIMAWRGDDPLPF
jgi:DNA ligase 1